MDTEKNKVEVNQMSVYLFGDTHGTEEYSKILPERFKDANKLKRDDVVIVLGDFGIPFITHGPNWYFKRSDKTAIKKLKLLPYTLLFVDGNHDNHNFWVSQPKQVKFGGKVQALRGTDNVFHLMRGEVYEIQGKTFWVMGGALSHDVEQRRYNIDWWPGEIPSENEFKHGINTLKEHCNKVDYILTHTVPVSALECLKYGYGNRFNNRLDTVSKYLDTVLTNVSYRYWFAGHLHIDESIPELRLKVLYDEHIKLL